MLGAYVSQQYEKNNGDSVRTHIQTCFSFSQSKARLVSVSKEKSVNYHWTITWHGDAVVSTVTSTEMDKIPTS